MPNDRRPDPSNNQLLTLVPPSVQPGHPCNQASFVFWPDTFPIKKVWAAITPFRQDIKILFKWGNFLRSETRPKKWARGKRS